MNFSDIRDFSLFAFRIGIEQINIHVVERGREEEKKERINRIIIGETYLSLAN